MAVITDYATLDTAVDDYLARSDLSAYVPLFIEQAESQIYRNLRLRTMETTLSGTISSGTLAVPATYLELKYAYVNRTPTNMLEMVAPEEIYRMYPNRSASAVPKYIAREGTNFIFGPAAGAYDVAGIYWAQLPNLNASDPTTNWFTTNAPDVLLYGALLQAAPFLRDDVRIPVWKVYYDAAMKAVKDEERRENRSGGTKAIRVHN